jgi:putative transposase
MRSRLNDTISSAQVQQYAASLIEGYLQLEVRGRVCTLQAVISVLLWAAARVTSIHDACSRLRRAPCDDAVRGALKATLPKMAELERRLNAALVDWTPRGLKRRDAKGRGLIVAMDLCEIPYHGLHKRDPREICRGQAKSGTTHFHTYATAYLVHRGERLTLALTHVWQHDSKADIVKRLLRRVRRQGLKVRYLLLDRGFYNIDVIRYLQRARCPFLMPVVNCRGKGKDLAKSKSAARFLVWKRSGWSQHTLRNKRSSATVRIAVACDDHGGRRGKQGRRVLIFAYWGFSPPYPAWVREEYRRRFGIESSYRQMQQVRPRTTTRDPVMRLLLIGIALLLRNIWVRLHRTHFSRPQRGRRILQLAILRLRQLLDWIAHQAEQHLGGIHEELTIPRPLSPLPTTCTHAP